MASPLLRPRLSPIRDCRADPRTRPGRAGRTGPRPPARAASPVLPRFGAAPPSVPRWKRVLDLTLVALAFPLVTPVMAAIAIWIKCASRGPVLFGQERVGLGGRRFRCLKFRTMHVGASTAQHEAHMAELIRSGRPMTKLDGNDPRLIRMAWLLRATGLDELPQVINILRGEMSVVGPRPGTVPEYLACSPSQRGRTGALPGLTGLWQVHGKNHTTFEEMIRWDLLYIRTCGPWLDLGILGRTPWVIVQQVAETASPLLRLGIGYFKSLNRG